MPIRAEDRPLPQSPPTVLERQRDAAAARAHVSGDRRADWRIGATAWLLCMIGVAAERWLFFADARHAVRLYHGDRTT